MTDLPHLASRIFGVPLLVERGRLDAMLSVVGPRLGLSATPRADDGQDDGRRSDGSGPRVSRGCVVTPSGVGVVPVIGTLVARGGRITADCTELRSYAVIKADLMAMLNSPHVRGVVLDIDSGGGEVANCLELAQHIASMRGRGKPIIAVANTAAFSAAYALATAADHILVPQSGGVGSVGVVAVHVDVSGEDEKKGHRYTYVAAGARKLDGNPHAPLSSEAEAVIAAEVERLYGLFVGVVAANRPGLSAAAIRATEAGLLFGDAAVKAKFADQIGGIEEAIRLAAGNGPYTARGRQVAQPAMRGNGMASISPAGGDTTVDLFTIAVGNGVETTLGSGGGGSAAPSTPPIVTPGATVTVNTGATSGPDDSAEQIRREATAAASARARGIAALCNLAGVPHRAADLISGNHTEAEVRDMLLAERAGRSDEGGEVSPSRGAATPALNPAGNSVAAAASWDRIGRRVFGDAWKGI